MPSIGKKRRCLGIFKCTAFRSPIKAGRIPVHGIRSVILLLRLQQRIQKFSHPDRHPIVVKQLSSGQRFTVISSRGGGEEYAHHAEVRRRTADVPAHHFNDAWIKDRVHGIGKAVKAKRSIGGMAMWKQCYWKSMTSAYSKPSVGKPGVTRTRKTRIVCISDTHNQTPKLPPGDVLIHAGDLTNQGSFAELKKSVEWLEKADFEAKIVVAGNHEITLDEPFFREKETKWKWPEPQDPAACRKLLTDSSSITYLENSAATIYLTKRQTCFRVFGSPYSPGRRGWAFQYWGEDEAENMWRGIEDDADIVITHTPAHGHCDAATKDDRSGCASLTQRIAEIRPLLHICGHIHEARGVERVKWSPGASSPTNRRTVETTEYWKDPGAGNKKISLVDLTAKVGRSLDNAGRLTRHVLPDSARDRLRGQRDAVAQHEGPRQLHGVEESNPTSSLEDIALCSEAGVERWTSKAGGAIECRLGSEVGRSSEVDAHTDAPQQQQQRNETVMINAAFLGPRIAGKAMEFNKPIVVDVELPVWDFDTQNV